MWLYASTRAWVVEAASNRSSCNILTIRHTANNLWIKCLCARFKRWLAKVICFLVCGRLFEPLIYGFLRMLHHFPVVWFWRKEANRQEHTAAAARFCVFMLRQGVETQSKLYDEWWLKQTRWWCSIHTPREEAHTQLCSWNGETPRSGTSLVNALFSKSLGIAFKLKWGKFGNIRRALNYFNVSLGEWQIFSITCGLMRPHRTRNNQGRIGFRWEILLSCFANAFNCSFHTRKHMSVGPTGDCFWAHLCYRK